MKSDTHAVSIGAARFDPVAAEVLTADGSAAPLRPQTAEVLRVLIAQRGQLVQKSDLMERVWKDTFVTEDSLVQCISEIRKALGATDGKLLKTVPKQGYRLEGEAGEDESARLVSRRLTRVLPLVALALALGLAGIRLWPVPAPAAPAVLAVLPFENLSGDPEQAYLSDGMAVDLITDLSKISALTVISRTSTFAYKDKALDVREIGTELGASHVVEGSVLRVGDRLRITAQLVETATGTQVWADRFDRDAAQILALQDEVRGTIIEALEVRLTRTDRERLARELTTSPDAYDHYLRGLREISFFGEAANRRAQQYFEAAIAADPDFAAAYAQLAQAYSLAIENEWGGVTATPENIDRAVETAQRGIALDPEMPMAYWSLGRIYSRGYLREEQLALEALEKSIELDPNFADGYMLLGSAQVKLGHPQRALGNIEKAMRLNPDGPFWYIFTLGQAQYVLGRFEAAADTFRQTIEKNPTVGWPRRWFIAAAGQLGWLDEAEWEMMELEALGEPVSIEDFRRRSVFMDSAYEAILIEGLRKAGVPEN